MYYPSIPIQSRSRKKNNHYKYYTISIMDKSKQSEIPRVCFCRLNLRRIKLNYCQPSARRSLSFIAVCGNFSMLWAILNSKTILIICLWHCT